MTSLLTCILYLVPLQMGTKNLCRCAKVGHLAVTLLKYVPVLRNEDLPLSPSLCSAGGPKLLKWASPGEGQIC